jgi:hypothetical protein
VQIKNFERTSREEEKKEKKVRLVGEMDKKGRKLGTSKEEIESGT